jgi:hypothetical protein
LSTAAIKADNSSVTADSNIGSMPLPVRFKTALRRNNYGNYGKSLKTIGTSTKSSMTGKVTRFSTKSGQNAAKT